MDPLEYIFSLLMEEGEGDIQIDPTRASRRQAKARNSRVSRRRHPWAYVPATPIPVFSLEEVMAYFKEYAMTESDDTDSITVVYSGGHVTEIEGKSLDLCWEEVALPEPGERFTVHIFHDCPGCCRAGREKHLHFIKKEVKK